MLAFGCHQRLLDIPNNICHMLDADGEAHQVFADTGGGKFIGIELPMRGAGRVTGKTFGIAYIH